MTKERMNPPLPRVRPQAQAKEASLVGSARSRAKSVLTMGSKRDQPMGLALTAWLGGCCLNLGASRPQIREKSGHSVLTLSGVARYQGADTRAKANQSCGPAESAILSPGMRSSRGQLLSTDVPARAGQLDSLVPQQGQASHLERRRVCNSQEHCCPSKECPGLFWRVRPQS